jgi:hypothetical protein
MPPSLRNVKFPNVLYVVLLSTSTFFVMTILAWLMVPALKQIQAEDLAKGQASRVDRRSLEFANWVDDHATTVLTYEFVIMLVSGSLAMGLDILQEKKGKG